MSSSHSDSSRFRNSFNSSQQPPYDFDTLEIEDIEDAVSVLDRIQERRRKIHMERQRSDSEGGPLGDGSPSSVRGDGSSGRELGVHTFLRVTILKHTGELSVL